MIVTKSCSNEGFENFPVTFIPQISNISLTRSENLNFPRLAMQLSLCNI